MNLLGHRLVIACGAILSALAPAHSSGAEPPVAPPANGLVRVSPNLRATREVPRVVPPESLVLKGISTMGKEPVALLSVKPPSPGARPTALDAGLEQGLWFATGDSFFGYTYTVKVIAPDHVILVRPSTTEIKIPLASAPHTASDTKPYSKAWINSPANPMLFHAQPMPGRMYGGNWDPLTGNISRMDGGIWDELPGKNKKQVVEFYRKHGWQLIPVKTGPGPTDFEWRNLYAAERAAAIEANREKFERTLTPEQLGLWKQRGETRGLPGGITDPERRFTMLRGLTADRQRIIDEFEKSLTPEQKAERQGIGDFTKASWK